MTDDQLFGDLRITLTASRGKTGKLLRTRLTEMSRTTTARTGFDEAIDRASRCAKLSCGWLIETRRGDQEMSTWLGSPRKKQ